MAFGGVQVSDAEKATPGGDLRRAEAHRLRAPPHGSLPRKGEPEGVFGPGGARIGPKALARAARAGNVDTSCLGRARRGPAGGAPSCPSQRLASL